MVTMIWLGAMGAHAAEAATADARIDWFGLQATERFDPFEAPSYGPALAMATIEEPTPAPRVERVQPKARVAVTKPAPTPTETAGDERKAPAPTARVVETADTPTRLLEYCGEPAELEVKAVLGKLSREVVDCLVIEVEEAPKMVQRIYASELLLTQRFAMGDRKGWARQAAYHLDRLDRSDPNLAYKFALTQLRADQPIEAIRWAEVALENRSVWTGETHVVRVDSLHKIRAQAAHQLWTSAEAAALADPTAATRAGSAEARGRAKEHARAWLEYARVAGRPTDKALALCTAAAGTEAYCSE